MLLLMPSLFPEKTTTSRDLKVDESFIKLPLNYNFLAALQIWASKLTVLPKVILPLQNHVV